MRVLRLKVCMLVLGLVLGWGASAIAKTTVDLMLVYESSAADWVQDNGGLEVFASEAVQKLNQVVSNTEIDLEFNLVRVMEADYQYSGDMADDLRNVQSGEGSLQEVHEQRDEYGADLVNMLVDTGSSYNWTGVAYLLESISGRPEYGYSVSSVRAVDIGNVMSHEVGHNFGAGHSKDQALDPGPNSALNSYSAGWYFTGNNGVDYHTIMAYNDDGSGNTYTKAPLFSTPKVSYQGTVAGDPEDGDNARTIRETMGAIAEYRESAEQSGALAVSIEPEEARSDGAMWRRAGTVSWHSSGYTETDIPPGEYELELKAVSGWRTPDNIQASIEAGQTTEIDVKYEAEQQQVETPSFIVIPSQSSTGSYEVSWGSSDTSGVEYVLEEAEDEAFGKSVRTAYTGSALSTEISGRESGKTYYYRVKAVKDGYEDSEWREGSNGCQVGSHIEPEWADSHWVTSFYVAYWERSPDPEGYEYWIGEHESQGLEFAAIAENFARSPEGQNSYAYFEAAYDPDRDISQEMRQEFVIQVYQNLFNREPGQSAQDYWVNELTAGDYFPGRFIADVVHSAQQDQGEDWEVLWNKIQVAAYFQTRMQEEYGFEWNAGDKDNAQEVLLGVSSDPASVQAGKDKVEELL